MARAAPAPGTLAASGGGPLPGAGLRRARWRPAPSSTCGRQRPGAADSLAGQWRPGWRSALMVTSCRETEWPPPRVIAPRWPTAARRPCFGTPCARGPLGGIRRGRAAFALGAVGTAFGPGLFLLIALVLRRLVLPTGPSVLRRLRCSERLVATDCLVPPTAVVPPTARASDGSWSERPRAPTAVLRTASCSRRARAPTGLVACRRLVAPTPPAPRASCSDGFRAPDGSGLRRLRLPTAPCSERPRAPTARAYRRLRASDRLVLRRPRASDGSCSDGLVLRRPPCFRRLVLRTCSCSDRLVLRRLVLRRLCSDGPSCSDGCVLPTLSRFPPRGLSFPRGARQRPNILLR